MYRNNQNWFTSECFYSCFLSLMHRIRGLECLELRVSTMLNTSGLLLGRSGVLRSLRHYLTDGQRAGQTAGALSAVLTMTGCLYRAPVRLMPRTLLFSRFWLAWISPRWFCPPKKTAQVLQIHHTSDLGSFQICDCFKHDDHWQISHVNCQSSLSFFLKHYHHLQLTAWALFLWSQKAIKLTKKIYRRSPMSLTLCP